MRGGNAPDGFQTRDAFPALTEDMRVRAQGATMKPETKNLLAILGTIAATGLAVTGVVVALHVSVILQVSNVQEDIADVRERLARIETRLAMSASTDSTSAPVQPGALTSALSDVPASRPSPAP